MKFFWQRQGEDEPEHRASTFGASSFGASSMALLMIAPTAEVATADQAKVSVSATVLKHASLKVLAQPAAVVVTAADIERGYVDVPAPAQVAIKSNSARGYMLEFANDGDFIRTIVVKGLSTDVQLSPAGGAVMQSSTGVTRSTLDLGFRFMLARSAQAGTYAWPLHLSVTPI